MTETKFYDSAGYEVTWKEAIKQCKECTTSSLDDIVLYSSDGCEYRLGDLADIEDLQITGAKESGYYLKTN